MMMGFGPVSGMFRPPQVGFGPPSLASQLSPSAMAPSLPLIAGAALAGAMGAMYMNRTIRPKPVEIGPRDWSPRTGKCLCKKHGKDHGIPPA